MASDEKEAPKLFAHDIAAYNDADLDRYLEENGRYVDVEDPENLPGDFIQRLRDRAHRASDTADSHPIDLDQVAARLQELSRRSPSIATTAPYDPEEDYRLDVLKQTRFYNMLVDDGGRPSHPLSRLENIFEDPGEYHEILSYWQSPRPGANKDEWRVFEKQFNGWRSFRRLQRFARGQRGYDYWRSIWEEDRDISFDRRSEKDWEHSYSLDKKYDDRVLLGTSYVPWTWLLRRKAHTNAQQGFPEYCEALKERLARHGFTRTFQLEEDATRQDKMMTWIEYLGYEYWWYDRHTGIAREHQKQHDHAWKKLVDSGVLRPGETEEVLRDDKVLVPMMNERVRAETAVQSAMSAVSSAETAVATSHGCRLPPQTLQQELLAARSKLESAQEEYKSIKRRRDCISEFNYRVEVYQAAKKDAKHQTLLLRWMLQQIPLIESELSPPNERDSNKNGRINTPKRNRSEELDAEQDPAAMGLPEPASKRAKRTTRSSRNVTSSSTNPRPSTRIPEVSNSAGKTDPGPQDVKGKASSDSVPQTCKPLRRSARIAERAKLKAAISPQDRHKGAEGGKAGLNRQVNVTPRSPRKAKKKGRKRTRQ